MIPLTRRLSWVLFKLFRGAAFYGPVGDRCRSPVCWPGLTFRVRSPPKGRQICYFAGRKRGGGGPVEEAFRMR